MKTTNRIFHRQSSVNLFGHHLPLTDKPEKVLELHAGSQSFILFHGRCSREEWHSFLKQNNLIEAGREGLLSATNAAMQKILPSAANIFASLDGDHLAQAYRDLSGVWHHQDSCPQALPCGGNYFLARLAFS